MLRVSSFVAMPRDIHAVAVLLATALVLWTLAYQVPLHVQLAIGGDRQTHRRNDDAPFLHGFNASEPDSDKHAAWSVVRPGSSNLSVPIVVIERFKPAWWMLPPGYAFRWTERNATLTFPGIGIGHWIVTLHAGSGRPQNLPARSTWQVGEQMRLPLTIPAEARLYHLLASSDARGDLVVHMDTQPYLSPTDPRDLGFTLREVRIASTTSSPHLPALSHLGWLSLALVLVYLLLRWLVLPLRPALLAMLACATLIAILLAVQRLALTLFSPMFAGLALSCWGMACVAWLALNSWTMDRHRQIRRSKLSSFSLQHGIGAVIALALLAFALRAGGMLHPHAIFSDHRLHANNLLEVARGSIYFTEGLPNSRGGGQSPYPPGLYLFLAPVLTAVPPDIESRVLIIQLGVALLDSLVLVLLWWLLRQAGAGQPAALMGAALYLLPPPMMSSFSIGEYANLGAQVLALPVLALLGTLHDQVRVSNVSSLGTRVSEVSTLPDGGRQTVGSRRPSVLLFVVLLSIALLGHLGVAISLMLVLVADWGLALIGWIWQNAPPHRYSRGRRSFSHCNHPQCPSLPSRLKEVTVGGILAAALVALLYYSAPQFRALYTQRLTNDPTTATAPAPALSLLPTVGGIVSGLFAPGSRLLPLTVALGLLGVLLLWLWRGSAQTRSDALTALLQAWWLGTLLSFGLLLVAQQGVRWMHFLYPALCLGGGVGLSACCRRGAAGRVVAVVAVLAIISQALIMWIAQVDDYLH